MSQRSHLTNSEAWRVVGRLEGGQTQAEVAQAIGVSQKTPKYERYSSPTTPSLGYWHHGLNSDCPKPAPWCRTVCSLTDGMC
ncbi:hypothetical protein TNCV_600511 [Trichonephila clavipes]|nr:hypothetical protein TNCV_600511 [Trichonephila clavipes]